MNLNKNCGGETPNAKHSAQSTQNAQDVQDVQSRGGFCANQIKQISKNQNLNLNDFDAVIFDLDGVITTENAYWLCAAKTVRTLLRPGSLAVLRTLCGGKSGKVGNSGKVGEIDKIGEIGEIGEVGENESAETVYSTVMCDGKTVLEVKNKGVNTNYDLTYIVLACALKTACETGETGESESTKNTPHGAHCACAAAIKSGKLLIDFNKTLEEIKSFPQDAFKIYDICAEYLSRALEIPKQAVLRGNSLLYDVILDVFQYYFLGFDGVLKHYKTKTPAIGLLSLPKNREGFVLSDKKTAVPTKVLKKTLKALKDRGLRLGIGTGRPRIEAVLPLSGYGILDFFDPDMICTLSEVESAENALRFNAFQSVKTSETAKTLKNANTFESAKDLKNAKNARSFKVLPLSKPHPYVFLRALFGDETSDADILSGNYDHHRAKRALAVGDAAADMLAAKRGGLSFLGVLTGVDKESAKEVFLSGGADFILNDISEISKFL